jgi:hypothetical protein
VGVYFLLSDSEVVYVGKTTNLTTRVLSHSAQKDFDAVYYLPVKISELNDVERKYIKQLDPKYNNDYSFGYENGGERRVMFWLPDELLVALKAQALATGKSQKRLVVEALERKLKTKGKA